MELYLIKHTTELLTYIENRDERLDCSLHYRLDIFKDNTVEK